MLRSATAGLEGYCPVCLLPCLTPRHATRRHHTLPAHSRDRTNLQNSQHGQDCSCIGDHISSLSSRQQQPYGAHLLKAQQQGESQLFTAEQSVGDQEWQPVGANGAADCVGSRHGEADGGLSAQGADTAALAQQLGMQQQRQQQLQEQDAIPISDVEAAEAGKEMAEAWVTYLPTASQAIRCLFCMLQLQVHCSTHKCSSAHRCCTIVQISNA